MSGYLLDTNICIYAMRGRLLHVAREFEARRESIAISAISRAELDLGAARSAYPERSYAALSAFLADVPVLAFDAHAAEHFGEIKAQLYRKGRPVGPFDMLVGAHARSLDLTLVTNNRREFDRIPGLTVENWV